MADASKKIGFIGLGLMGQGFTRRLCAEGYAVHGFDLVLEKRDAASGHGVILEASARAVTEASDIVHICVMTKTDLEAAVFGNDGIAAAGSPEKILIDHSTTPVEVTKAFAARLFEKTGMAWIDAPVSGGPPAAEEGTLAIMAGGDDAAISRAWPVLNDLGKATHMGATGAGQVTKMVNQVVVLSSFCILAEALALAEAGGVDAEKIPAALGGGYAGSSMLQKIFPRMVARDYAPAGYLFQCMKDLDMIHDIARDLKVPTPMASQAASLYRIMMSKGHGDLDAISVLKLYDGEDEV